MQRLYVEKNFYFEESLFLEGDQAHYLIHVLRMKIGESLLLFNGLQGEHEGEIKSISKKFIEIKLKKLTREQSLPSQVHYAFAPLKAARLDYMVQKAVEMGACSLTPVLTQYTQLHKIKTERILANAIEAAEQCGVLCLPQVNETIAFDKYLSQLQGTLVFCDEAAPLGSAMQTLKGLEGDIYIFIGPEGGFSQSERERLLALPHVIRLSLGQNILRADTAAVAALALVNEALLAR
jgi:16S rRNA (uracil1498-N3)-methyltransferase